MTPDENQERGARKLYVFSARMGTEADTEMEARRKVKSWTGKTADHVHIELDEDEAPTILDATDDDA